MKIIFLDIDGVLNSHKWFHSKEFENLTKKASDLDSHHESHIDPSKVILLNQTIQKTGAKVVLSSTWRHYKDHIAALNRCGVNFIDKTTSKCPSYDIIDSYGGRNIERGWQIKQWLNEHLEVKSFVILDDDSDMLPSQMNFFVQTTFDEGLTQKHVDKAVEILLQ